MGEYIGFGKGLVKLIVEVARVLLDGEEGVLIFLGQHLSLASKRQAAWQASNPG